MAQPYQQLRDPTHPQQISGSVLRVVDKAHIPPDPANRDYQDYLAWCAEGNEPDPAPEPAPPAEDKAHDRG